MSVTDYCQRERAQNMRREKKEKYAPALDFSPFAVTADSGKVSVSDAEITCITIGLSEGYSFTACRSGMPLPLLGSTAQVHETPKASGKHPEDRCGCGLCV
jgi:hypothetical protein